jgi:chemotaxis protein CheD
MLPYAGRRLTLYQYADTAIPALLKEMLNKGAERQRIAAKMVGGARMFASYEDNSKGIGEQNISSIKDVLRKEQIPLIGIDVGSHHGRRLEFYPDSGRVLVMSIGKENKEI